MINKVKPSITIDKEVFDGRRNYLKVVWSVLLHGCKTWIWKREKRIEFEMKIWIKINTIKWIESVGSEDFLGEIRNNGKQNTLGYSSKREDWIWHNCMGMLLDKKEHWQLLEEKRKEVIKLVDDVKTGVCNATKEKASDRSIANKSGDR